MDIKFNLENRKRESRAYNPNRYSNKYNNTIFAGFFSPSCAVKQNNFKCQLGAIGAQAIVNLLGELCTYVSASNINANNTAGEEEVVAEEPAESSEEIAEEEIVEEEASNEAEDTPEDSPVSTVLSNLGKTDCAELKAALNRKYNTMIAVKSDISNEETLTRLTNLTPINCD